jgi:hypothetical protein
MDDAAGSSRERLVVLYTDVAKPRAHETLIRTRNVARHAACAQPATR